MFLSDLNDNERCAFLELAYRVANADGDLAEPEAQMLEFFRIELGVEPEAYEIRGMSIEEAASYFESDESRRAALMELMIVVMADGVAHPSEHAFLREVETAFGIDEETAERQFAWVQRLGALIATGRRMIAADDSIATAR